MRSILSKELAELVKELQWMKGFHLDKFYETSKDVFRIRLTRKGEGADLRIVLCKAVNKTMYLDEPGPAAPFAMQFRSILENATVEAISQLNNDRIIEITATRGDKNYKIIIEMFGKGNLIVTDSSNKIQIAYKHHKFIDRDISTGTIYVPPKNENKTNLKPEALQKEKIGSLEDILDKAYYEEQKANNATNEGAERKKKEEEITHSIEKQERILADADKEIETNRISGEAIFNNMALINKLIDEARSRKRITLEELADMFPSLKIKHLDLKDKIITIVLE